MSNILKSVSGNLLSSKHLLDLITGSRGVFCKLGNFPSNRSLMDSSPMADMFSLVSTSSPESFSFNWAATVRTRDLGSSDVMLHWSAVASMDSHGVWSGAGTLGGKFSSHPAEILGCDNTEGFATEMIDLGSHPKEVLGGGREGSGTAMTDSGSHPAEVLRGGREGSGTEMTDSGAHSTEVLDGGREGSGSGFTAAALSEFTIASASFSTIVPVEHTRLLNCSGVALVDSHFNWHLGFVFFLGFIFFLSLWNFTRAQSTAGHP